MILTSSEIQKQRDLGSLTIEPFEPKHLGPNSYDVRLAPQLLTYVQAALDTRRPNPTQELTIPDGLLIQPGELYLGSTVEVVGSSQFVVCLEGRSSLARLGISVHQTAGFGDLGFISRWTVEITAIRPVRIYREMRIAQAVFHRADGAIEQLYRGKYGRGSPAVEPSRSYLDLEAVR
jgi:dCTP deaminase